MYQKPRVILSNVSYQFFSRKNGSIRQKHEWIMPSGYDTGIKVFNRVKGENVPLIFHDRHFVKWYICGPTVYDVSHVGHASCYVRFDIIRRILDRYFDIKPIVAMGITDVDDKIIKRARDRNLDFRVLTKKYELEFFEDLNSLNVLPPAFILRVSDHIPNIIKFIEKIIDKQNAYVTEDGCVYFDTKTCKTYGKLCEIPEESGKKLRLGQKFKSDFALWKASKPDEPFWESPWGKGRPGWHIECSAMSSKVFGSVMDLHSGGIDLVFPHHENEEAQSCSYHGSKQWVNYWLHSGALMVSDQKMSKSLHNFVSIKEYLESNSSDTFRMFCFISSYKRGLHYGEDSLQLAREACHKISKFLSDANSYIKGNWLMGNVIESELLQKLHETDKNMRENLMNDFNTSACYILLMDLIKTTVGMMSSSCENGCYSPGVITAVSQYIQNTFENFGFRFNKVKESQQQLQDHKLDFILDSTVKFRQSVRAEALSCTNKELKMNILKACDTLRYDLGSVGIGIKDQSQSASSWSKIEIDQKEGAANGCGQLSNYFGTTLCF